MFVHVAPLIVSMGLQDYCLLRGKLDGDEKQVGICGEHGGEPSSVAFFAQVGLDYVSCSPFR